MALIWFDDVKELLSKGAPRGEYTISPIYSGPFPAVSAPDHSPLFTSADDVELTCAQITKVSVSGDEYAVVVLCRMTSDGTPQWAVYCGDLQVQGVVRDLGEKLGITLDVGGTAAKAVCEKLKKAEWVNTVPNQASCGFFSIQARNPKKVCTHVAHVLSFMEEDTLRRMADDVGYWVRGIVREGSFGFENESNTPSGMSAEEAAVYDAAFIQHVLLAGERGSGKTYLARQVAEKYDAVYLEMQMHPSMEAWEFRAHDRAWNGKVYTVLGKLAEAVYWIQKGKRVVLCMDEFLNMNPMYTTAINSPLTLTANDTYLIETGRIIDEGDGIGRLETVEVPSDMFWVVATTNVGARYNIDKIPPSVRARFQIILMNTNPERTASILEKNLTKYDMPLELAEMFRKFIERCHTAVMENTLDEEATTRLACNAIRAVHKKATRDKKPYKSLVAWLPAIKKQVMLEIAQVVNFESGPLDPEQAEIYQTMVNACFKVGR